MRKNLVILIILCLGALSFGKEINTLNKIYIGDQIEDFNIDLVNGDIRIIPSVDNKFRIEMVSKDKIRYIEKKDIKSHEYNVEIKSLKEKGWFHKEGKIDVAISVPTNNSGDIKLNIVNSKIDITSVKANLKIDLVNGEINIKNLDGKLSVNTVNGDIKGKKISKINHIETVRGSITLDGNELLKSSHLETVVGSIDLNVNKIGGRNNITTVIGGVSLNVKNLKDINKYDEVYSFDGKNVNIETMIGKIKINK